MQDMRKSFLLSCWLCFGGFFCVCLLFGILRIRLLISNLQPLKALLMVNKKDLNSSLHKLESFLGKYINFLQKKKESPGKKQDDVMLNIKQKVSVLKKFNGIEERAKHNKNPFTKTCKRKEYAKRVWRQAKMHTMFSFRNLLLILLFQLVIICCTHFAFGSIMHLQEVYVRSYQNAQFLQNQLLSLRMLEIRTYLISNLNIKKEFLFTTSTAKEVF